MALDIRSWTTFNRSSLNPFLPNARASTQGIRTTQANHMRDMCMIPAACNPATLAVRRAAGNYQALYRILDLISGEEPGALAGRVASIEHDLLKKVVSPYCDDLSGACDFAAAFLAANADAVDGRDFPGAVLELKRRGMREYLATVRDYRTEVRRERMERHRPSPSQNPFETAMSVTTPPDGSWSGPVVRAAVLYKGFAWSKPAPARHSDIINGMFPILGEVVDTPQTDGFITASGHFLNRVEALLAAVAAGQKFIEPPVSEELFSENLW
jgi:hypothetical protein